MSFRIEGGSYKWIGHSEFHERRSRRRQTRRADVPRRRRCRATGARRRASRPHRHARSAGDGRLAAGDRSGNAAGVLDDAAPTRSTSRGSASGSRPRPTMPKGSPAGELRAADRPALSESVVDDALRGFVGRYQQTPPPFSAKKIGGTPAYKLARRGSGRGRASPSRCGTRASNCRAMPMASLRCASSPPAGFTCDRWPTISACGSAAARISRACAGRGPDEFTLTDAVSLEASLRRPPTAVTSAPDPDGAAAADLPSVVLTVQAPNVSATAATSDRRTLWAAIPGARDASGEHRVPGSDCWTRRAPPWPCRTA